MASKEHVWLADVLDSRLPLQVSQKVNFGLCAQMLSLSDISCPSRTTETHYVQQLEFKSAGSRLAFLQSRPAPLQTRVMSQQE